MDEPTTKRAKTETSESASTTGDTQGVSTPVSMDNADSMNRGLSKQTSGGRVPDDWFLPGPQDFKHITEVGAFADHTLLIEKLLNHHPEDNTMFYEPVLITAPRRIGKTINLSMVKCFLEIQCDENKQPIKGPTDLEEPVKDTTNYELFAGMNIMEHTALVDEHFGRHPVIYLNFKGAIFSKPDDVLSHCRRVLSHAIKRHEYLEGKLDEEGNMFFSSWCHYSYKKIEEHIVRQSLLRLVQYLYNYFQRKVFILVDEYDAFSIKAIRKLKKQEVEDANELFLAVLGPAIKGSTECVQGAMLTGICYAGIGMSDGLNNVQLCRFLDDHKFVEFYGFTESEVERIAEVYVQAGGEQEVIEKLRDYYNGYETACGKKMYSTWSVGHTLQNDQVKNYWTNSGTFYRLEDMLKIPKIFVHILELLNGKNLTIEFRRKVTVDDIMSLNEMMKSRERIPDRDLLFSMMLEEGYLSRLKSSEKMMQEVQGELQIKEKKVTVRLPNEEIKSEIRYLTERRFECTWGYKTDMRIEECATFFKNIKSFGTQDDAYTFALKKFHDGILTELFEQFSDEEIQQINEDHLNHLLHCLMYGVFIEAHYRRSTEHWLYHEGKAVGRWDLLMLRDGDFGIIVEVKCNRTREKGKSSLACLEQILSDTTKYMSALAEHNIEKYFLIGISIDNDGNPSISCLLNSTEVGRAEHLPDYKNASCT